MYIVHTAQCTRTYYEMKQVLAILSLDKWISTIRWAQTHRRTLCGNSNHSFPKRTFISLHNIKLWKIQFNYKNRKNNSGEKSAQHVLKNP